MYIIKIFYCFLFRYLIFFSFFLVGLDWRGVDIYRWGVIAAPAKLSDIGARLLP